MTSGGDDDESGAADDPGKPAFWLRGLEEAPTNFEGQDAPALDTYAALYRSVLASYRYRCALTGAEAQLEHLDAGM